MSALKSLQGYYKEKRFCKLTCMKSWICKPSMCLVWLPCPAAVHWQATASQQLGESSCCCEGVTPHWTLSRPATGHQRLEGNNQNALESFNGVSLCATVCSRFLVFYDAEQEAQISDYPNPKEPHGCVIYLLAQALALHWLLCLYIESNWTGEADETRTSF